MSGIVGVYRRDGAVVRDEIEAMTARLAHRGPDRAGVWVGDGIGLGHRLLETTPESRHEILPDATSSRGLVITADARIDNRDELFSVLGLRRARGATPDSALIVAAYEKWAERCPEFLLGDFAFAIWDKRRQLLFCARDAAGIRPFFFHASARRFAFASELGALLPLPGVSSEIDESKVVEFLEPDLRGDAWATFYRDVGKIPPAHSLSVVPGSTVSRRYWTLDPKRELRFRTDAQYAEAFLDVFTEAVRCRLRSTHPAGAMLSGGLDSSAVVGVARKLLSERGGGLLPTFSLLFDDPLGDERRYIQAVVSGGGIEPHYVAGEGRRPLHETDRLLRRGNEPFWVPSIALQSALYETARGAGVRVMLDGLGGDQVVSYGYSLLTELSWSGSWLKVGKEIAALSRVGAMQRRTALWSYAIKPNVPGMAREVWRAARPRSASSFIRPELERRRRRNGRLRPAPLDRTARGAHVLGILDGLPKEILDRTAAEFSIEPRYPFFDRRLIELCVALPPDQKLRRGSTRTVVRRALDGLLPDEVNSRQWKATPVASLTRDLFVLDRDLLDRVVLDGPSGELGRYVDLEALGRAYRRYVQLSADDGVRPEQTWPHVASIWKTVVLGLWLEAVRSGARSE